MKFLYKFSLIFLQLLWPFLYATDTVDEKIFYIDHSLSPGKQQYRGKVTINFTSNQQVKFEKFSKLTIKDIENLNILRLNGGYYKLRIISALSDQYLLKSIKACRLKIRNNIIEEKWEFISDIYGNIISFEYRTLLRFCSTLQISNISQANINAKNSNLKFSSQGKLVYPRVDKKKNTIQKKQNIKIENSPQYKKYWHWILIGIIVMIIQAAMAQAPGST